jgi:hypothetical protein
MWGHLGLIPFRHVQIEKWFFSAFLRHCGLVGAPLKRRQTATRCNDPEDSQPSSHSLQWEYRISRTAHWNRQSIASCRVLSRETCPICFLQSLLVTLTCVSRMIVRVLDLGTWTVRTISWSGNFVGDVHLDDREADGRISLRWLLGRDERWVELAQKCVQWRWILPHAGRSCCCPWVLFTAVGTWVNTSPRAGAWLTRARVRVWARPRVACGGHGSTDKFFLRFFFSSPSVSFHRRSVFTHVSGGWKKGPYRPHFHRDVATHHRRPHNTGTSNTSRSGPGITVIPAQKFLCVICCDILIRQASLLFISLVRNACYRVFRLKLNPVAREPLHAVSWICHQSVYCCVVRLLLVRIRPAACVVNSSRRCGCDVREWTYVLLRSWHELRPSNQGDVE